MVAPYRMDHVPPPSLDPLVFDNNLAALRNADAELAAQVERAAGSSAGVEAARTRDGQVNLRLAGDGQSAWFGRSSIPLVRAEVLLEKFEVGTGNVLLPGIGQGQEVTLLLQRLGGHRAVFVWEQAWENIALALRLHPWSDAIVGQRLVFLVCPPENLTNALVRWLDAHAGHLCPERIMMWPWSALPDLSACRTAVQLAYDQIDHRRSAALSREANEYAAAPTTRQEPAAAVENTLTAGPLPVFALHVRDEVRALAESISAAASERGLQAYCLAVANPGDVHPLARLRALRRVCSLPPPAALLLDCSRQQLAQVLPNATPAITWLGCAVQPLAPVVAGVGQRDMVVATSSRVRDRIAAAGWSRPAPPVVPYPCLLGPDAFGDPACDRPTDVLILADVAPTDPEPYGYNLHTHAQLWRVACDLIKARIETFAEDEADSLLARAEEKLGSRLEEGGVRRTMLEYLGTSLANGLFGSFLAQVLAENGFTFSVAGRGWSRTPFGDKAVPLQTVCEYGRVFRRAKVVVLGDVTGEVSWLPLLAAGSGAVVVARSHPRDTQPGGLATLLAPGKEMVAYQYARELLTIIRQLISNTAVRREIATSAIARCRSDHTPARRLDALQTAANSYISSRQEQL